MKANPFPVYPLRTANAVAMARSDVGNQVTDSSEGDAIVTAPVIPLKAAPTTISLFII